MYDTDANRSCAMLIPTPTRRAIHEALFADGVLVAIKNVHHKEHCTIKTASNLHVIKAMQVSRVAFDDYPSFAR